MPNCDTINLVKILKRSAHHLMIRRFFSYYKPHKRLFFIDFSSAIIVAVLELAFPLVVQWFIDTLIPGETGLKLSG